MTGILLLIIGFFAFITGIRLLVSYFRLKKWKVVNGKLIRKEVELTSKAGSLGPPAFRYESFVQYRYLVNGKEYEGNKIYPFGWMTSSYKNRKKFIEKFLDSVEIKYNPQNPADSYLLLHSLYLSIAILFSSLLTLFIGLICLLH